MVQQTGICLIPQIISQRLRQQEFVRATGNLRRIADGTIERRYEHDALSRLTRLEWFILGEPFRSLSYRYDAASNRVRMEGPEPGEATHYSYDADNRPEDILQTEPGGSPTRLMIRHVYTSGGLLARKELGNGVHETRSYDRKQRLLQIRACSVEPFALRRGLSGRILKVGIGKRETMTSVWAPARAMTRSPVALAREAFSVARAALPAYGYRFSRHDFTQARLVAILVLRQFFRTDYRGIVQILEDFSDLQREMGLKKAPQYSTLCYAHRRLVKKGSSTLSSEPSLHAPISVD